MTQLYLQQEDEQEVIFLRPRDKGILSTTDEPEEYTVPRNRDLDEKSIVHIESALNGSAIRSNVRSANNFIQMDGLTINTMRNGRVMVVTSTKGGIGKTTLAMSLARHLHDLGKGRTIIVDLQHPHGNVASRLRIKSEVNVMSWLPYLQQELDEVTLLSKLVVRLEEGYYVLPAVEIGQTCPMEAAAAIIRELKRYFDLIIVDMGPEQHDLLVSVMKAADKTFVVIDYDFSTLKDVGNYTALWKKQGISDNVFALVNFDRGRKGRNKINRETCERLLREVGISIVGYLPEADNMRSIHNEGKLLVHEQPKHPFTKACGGVLKKSFPEIFAKPKQKEGFIKRWLR
ncbi:AAA family ATPase [Brevibacillus humidisoli]|uniref:AAA family ATPase n=1 Tax=Brevibacillus humidisoli TaxID=2895522 RepID=UPI001E64BD3C|nr:AAA family ATPase [Brevibacillus humidisoli]UFJ41322.1 AAA family ATPase [Brevibacillus humidisoli]